MMGTENFLAELTELTRKYNIEIGGCGCCSSPWLVAITADEAQSQKYRVGSDDGGLSFTRPLPEALNAPSA